MSYIQRVVAKSLRLNPYLLLIEYSISPQQEQQHKLIMWTRDSGSEMSMAFTTREQRGMIEKSGCKVCGRYRHDKATCYEVIGYPPRWGSRGRGRGGHGGRNSRGGRGGSKGRGFACEGVVAAVHYDGGSGPSTTIGPGAVAGVGVGSSAEPAQIMIPRLTSDQVQRLMSLIDTPKAGYAKLSGKVSWMLDSGASCHMAGDASIITELEKVSPVAIGLPNGIYTMACEKGSVILKKGLKLENVLLVSN